MWQKVGVIYLSLPIPKLEEILRLPRPPMTDSCFIFYIIFLDVLSWLRTSEFSVPKFSYMATSALVIEKICEVAYTARQAIKT
jgi:hypothetical protein